MVFKQSFINHPPCFGLGGGIYKSRRNINDIWTPTMYGIFTNVQNADKLLPYIAIIILKIYISL